ncbi:general transcriptional corepressor TUP1, partial [Lecanoromycetidae sp. Uapishka_2]
MYNAHRGMVQPPNNNNNPRLTELFEQIQREFDIHAQNRAGEHDQSMASQMQEMELVRQKVYELERNQIQIKQRYEEDVARLRHEIEARGGPPSHVGVSGLPPHGGVSQPAPPAIGHGPSNLFGGIMANPPGQGNPGLVPPTQDPQQQPQQGPPPHPMSQPPQGLQQGPYQGNYPQPPLVNGYGSQAQIASPGPGKPRTNRGPLGHASTPQQSQSMPYPGASPQMGRPSPPPQQFHNVGNVLADLDPDQMRSDQKREGTDWFAVFNPNVRRSLDVDLVHNLVHESVVCCVRFSRDGRYVATGCNRSAQIFDVNTGAQVTKLQDDSVDKDGDLYIRSVCFSPDGNFLATGAEDKLIRVWDIQSRTIRTTFAGHEQDIYSLDFASNGRHIASGSGDHTVRVWDLEQNREILNLVIEDGVTTVAISPGGEYVAAGSLDKSVRVWDIRAGNIIGRLDGMDGHKDSVYSVAFGPDGDTLVSGSLDKTIKMWRLSPENRGMMSTQHGRSGRLVRTFEGHKDFVLSVAMTPDGEWVMSGSKDRGVQFWNPHSGDTQLMLQGHKNSVISVAPSPQGGLFATGSGDMRARIWRIYKGIVNYTAKQGYRADLRQEAVARASAIRESQRPKKDNPEPKLRGSKAKKAEEKAV